MSAAHACSSSANVEALRAHLAVLESVYKFGVNASSSSNSSFDDATLATIFSYLGPGHWLFLGPVCKQWCELYRELCAQHTREVRADGAHCTDCAISSGLERPFSTFSNPYIRNFRPWREPAPKCSASTYTLYRAVVESGSRVGLARSCGCQIQNWCFVQAAAKLADKRTLIKAHRHGMPLSSAAAEIARRGDKDLLEWHLIHYHCGDIDARVPAAAAESGNVQVLAWLVYLGVVLRDAEISTAAAKSGSVAMCELVQSTPCKWGEEALAAAVDGQHAELFAWMLPRRPLYELGRPDPMYHNSIYRIYRVRLMRSDLAGLEWVEAHGAPLPEPGELRKLMNEAATQQNLFAVQWLVAHEAPWPPHLHAGWQGDCLEYIREAGCDSPMQAELAHAHALQLEFEQFEGFAELFDLGFAGFAEHMPFNLQLMPHIEL